MDEQPQIRQLFRLIEQAESYADTQDKARQTALKYYNADPKVIPNAGTAYSEVVSADVRKCIQQVMPSIMRTILSNDRIVQYEPGGPGKEAEAEQATDYVNGYIVPECDAERAIHDAIMDALLVKSGILNWTAYRQRRVVVQSFTGQDEAALLGLDELGDVFDVSRDAAGLMSFKLRRVEDQVKLRLRAVPRGAFLIHPEARSIEDSPIVGERQSITRSELVSRGYDRDQVWEIPVEDNDNDPNEADRRGDDYDDSAVDADKALERVTVYDVFATLDADGDGIAELHHFVVADGGGDKSRDTKRIVLEHEYAPEVPYAEVIGEYEAHQFEGHSLAEDVIEPQRINTTLMRQALDNMYEVNNPTPYIQVDAIEDLEPLFKPVRGKPVMLASGRTFDEAVNFRQTPFIADKAMLMKAAIDEEVKDRTGISDASGGLPGEALQGMTATAANMLNEASIARAGLLVRNLARGGIRKAFRGLLRLVIAHADKARVVRLRGEWVEVDPRVWDAEMDCTVNVGLGAGTRERDMAVIQQILGLQQTIMTALGADNPLVKPDQLYNSLKKMVETAGLASADPYFTKPDPQEIAAKQQASAQQPTPEQIKAQTQVQIEQAKAQARAEVESAQMQADLQVKNAEIAGQRALAELKIASDAEIARRDAEIEMLKHRDQMALEWARLGQQGMTHVAG